MVSKYVFVFFVFFFFFNDTATTEIYTLSLHDALPIYRGINDVDSLPQLVANVDGYGAYFANELGVKVENQIGRAHV